MQAYDRDRLTVNATNSRYYAEPLNNRNVAY